MVEKMDLRRDLNLDTVIYNSICLRWMYIGASKL